MCPFAFLSVCVSPQSDVEQSSLTVRTLVAMVKKFSEATKEMNTSRDEVSTSTETTNDESVRISHTVFLEASLTCKLTLPVVGGSAGFYVPA